MPTQLRRVLVTMTVLVIAPLAQAQSVSDLTVSGQLRHRSEFGARDFNADTTPAGVHLLRTRLNAAFQPANEVTVFVQIQDARRFGDGDPARARGTMDPGAGRSTIEASLLSIHAGYVLIPRQALRLGAGYTRLSGDDAPSDGTLGLFNTLFATNHAFYGAMDFFPALAAPLGLQDAHVNLSARVSEQVRLSAAVHHFAQAETNSTRPARTLGQELDLTLTYDFADGVTFEGGLSGFLPDDAMKQATGNSDMAYWGYVMTTIHF